MSRNFFMPYLVLPPKKKQIPPLKFSKKTGFPPPNRSTKKCNSIISRSMHQVSGFTFPTNCPHSILPILAVFFREISGRELWVWVFFQNLFRFRLRGEHPIGISSHEHHLDASTKPRQIAGFGPIVQVLLVEKRVKFGCFGSVDVLLTYPHLFLTWLLHVFLWYLFNEQSYWN